MEISEIGAWNIDIHHRYNFHDGVFQRGDGHMVYFKNEAEQLVLDSVAGHHLQPRPFACSSLQCNTESTSARFFSLTALSNAPDGSVFVGDGDLIRRISPDGRIFTVYQFKTHSTRQSYEYYIAYNSIDGYLYISDPDRFQIFRVQM